MTKESLARIIDELKLKIDYQSANVLSAMTYSHAVTEELALAKNDLLDAKNTILANCADPKELGANEAQREATIAKKTFAERTGLAGAEETYRRAQHDLTLAQLAFDATKLQIRLLECASRLLGAGE